MDVCVLRDMFKTVLSEVEAGQFSHKRRKKAQSRLFRLGKPGALPLHGVGLLVVCCV